jgi:hypothetical protein
MLTTGTPALDSQAVDRCYRISQTKEVHVYRLIAAGTVEEKMYEVRDIVIGCTLLLQPKLQLTLPPSLEANRKRWYP